MFSRKVDRREFLTTGSAAAIGLTAIALSPQSLLAAPKRAIDPLLGVGYAPSLPTTGNSVRLTAAGEALAGDPTFISRGARVTVSSFKRATRYQGVAGGTAIDVIHPAIGFAPAKYPRFRAWSYATDSNQVDNVGSAIAFGTPVTATEGLQFIVRRVAATKEEPATETPLALTLGSSSGAMKLQRGIYVVAFRESADDSAPSWGAHSLSSREGHFVVDTTAFSYAVLTIDYAE